MHDINNNKQFSLFNNYWHMMGFNLKPVWTRSRLLCRGFINKNKLQLPLLFWKNSLKTFERLLVNLSFYILFKNILHKKGTIFRNIQNIGRLNYSALGNRRVPIFWLGSYVLIFLPTFLFAGKLFCSLS